MQQDSLVGAWALEVNTPFGRHPATLVVERGAGGGELTGRVDSQIGSVPLAGLRAAGPEDYEATASHDVKGRTYTARLTARVNGDSLEGTIKVDFFLAPAVRFTGTRSAL